MNRAPVVVRWSQNDAEGVWIPTTLDRLDKDEKFLENILARNPELLGIQSRRTGIKGPFATFQSLQLPTPTGRAIEPDITLLAASGHFVVVEVKLSVNPELRDRRVIAQIIDYASAFANLDDEQLIKVFDKSANPAPSWADLICRLFQQEDHPEELADVLRDRVRSGELNLVIACDRVPPGVPDVVEGIASQQTTGFDLDLVEVVPFVEENNDASGILFIPSVRLSTEIVARTTVTVTYQQGETRPDVSVMTPRLSEIEENAAAAKSNARVWSTEEVEEAFKNDGDPIAMQLLEFAKKYSSDRQIISPSVKVNATFGFYIAGRKSDGKKAKLMFFYITAGFDDVWICLKAMRSIADAELAKQLDERLTTVFNKDFAATGKDVGISLSAVGQHLQDFCDFVLWFQEQAATRLVDE